MSQKTILSFFKQVDSSSNKIKSDKSSSNDDIEKQAKSSDVKEVKSNNNDTEKKAKSSDSKIHKSNTNNDTERKPKLNGDSGNSSSCVSDDAEKSSTKKQSLKSDSKNESPVTKKLPAKRNTKALSSHKSPKKSQVKDDKSKVNQKCENSIQDCFNDSPVKQPKKRKRIQQISDSDEDSKDSEEKEEDTPKRDDEKMEIDEDDESRNDADTEITNNAENLSKTPTKKSPEQPAKKRKTSQTKINGDEDLSANSVKKEEPNVSAISEKNSEDNSSENSGANQKNASCTPKRKTARKQVSGGKQKKESQPKASNLVLKEEAIEESKDSAISEKNSDASLSENSGANQKNDSCTPKRKTARKQVSGGKQKKVQPEASNSVQKENEVSIKSSSSPDKKTDDSKSEGEKSPEKTNEIVEHGSKSDEEESKSEEPDKESEKDEKKENSESKKAIHPFFGKRKEPVASSSEEKVAKKDIKCSSVAGTSYDPSKTRYHPIDDACWKKGEKTPYLALAKTLEIIEDTSARLKIVEILANYLRSVIVLSPEDLLHSVYLCLNRLAPEYEGIELGVGDMLLMKAVAQATGRTVDKIKAEVVVKGDLGLVAESSRGNQRIMFAPPKLTVSSVFSKFKEIAKMSGNTAMAKKVDKIQALFVACRECEARYIIRSLSGKLRIGLAEQSVLAALARAAVLTPPNQSYPPEIIDKSAKMSEFKEFLQEQTLILKTTYCECPNFDVVIPVLLKEGIAGLPTHCQLQPGCPLKPMLAHPTNGIDEVLNRFDKNEFTCEYKYDGERAQIHRTDKGEVKIFSRNQEDNTSKYPDVISRLPKTLKESTTSFILDTEAVAWDSETKQILPFQVLSTRKKKDAVESDIVVQVCIMTFDLLYLNGESLVKKPLKERRELLHSSFVEVENEFMFVKYRDGDNAETMQEFLDESVKGNCEGLMVKALTVDASYEIAKRSHNWLKLKKDYLNGIGDTLDLVVIGGYHGKGKRKGVYGGFLLACYDDENEEFQSTCKLGTGFGDKELETHTEFFKNHVISEPKSYYRYDSSLQPDVWFDAVQIWEIKCADLSISPVHKAAIGIVDPEKGISLRFPRFLRIREDKSKPEDATVASRIAEMYQKQEQVQNTKNKNMKSEEDYY
ncbi:DNA ligase 1 [Araneus ventricosus]|uniref:DNA ligase n=1 Tax=Araneus ventricosus TaxID=182803 RepID=A0A4Y2JK28_ARAVE|nr:DNA ligase 1 [Araneus ventricosus]